jgi:ATP-dependent DNA helicase RecG
MNAFIHRDFTAPEEVVIQINQRQFLVTNPGGFYRDVGPENILFHEPCPRNKALAQACADIGLVEKSGRGVDRIFLDQIRFLRPLPSYDASTTDTVRLSLLGGEGSREVVRWMIEFLGKREDLVVRVMHGGLMHVLLTEGQATREELIAALPGLIPTDGRRAITELIDAGLMRPIGHGRGQRLVLSAQLQEALGQPEAFIHQAGVDVEQRQRIMHYVEARGQITRSEAAELLGVPADVNMYRMLKRMVDDHMLRTEGKGSATRYLKA